jgi:nitroimidazol reductase NimA-like FMN-containing flavoprotein (pyridoxamine 5'-phosphate oxidase superfamily)
MLVHRMTSAECRIVLERARYGRLACARFDQPYVVPISIFYDIEEDAIYGFSTVGRKIRWMRDNPLVCVEIEEIESRADWRTVVVFGRYEELLSNGPGADLRERAMQLFGRRRAWWLPGAAKLEAAEPRPMPVIYRIRIGRMTGRRMGSPAST